MILYDRLGNPVAVPDAPQNDYMGQNQYNVGFNNQMQNRANYNARMGNNQMNQMTQQQNNQQIYLKGRPVSNIDEANASMIDFDGSLHIFTDVSNGKIYTKRMGMDGNIEFKVYSETGTTEQKQTKENEFLLCSVFEDFTEKINERISKLEGKN